jgi:DNA-binding transcriptional MerR regulator
LRHYHEVDLLAPVAIDPATGYRHYATSQLSTAQVISRLRELGVPVEEVRSILVAPEPEVI